MPDAYYRVPGWLRQQAGVGRIGADARTPARTAYGLAIENIERCFLNGTYKLSADLTGLASSTFANVNSTNLKWDVWFSGKRPVVMQFQCLARYVTGGGYVALSFMVDGVEVSGAGLGLWYMDVASDWRNATGTWVVDAPVGGKHTVALGYKVFSAGSLTVSSGVPVVVTVREV